MRFSLSSAAMCIAGVTLFAAPPARAVPVSIPGLYSTGVDDAGDPLPNNSPEIHYTFATVDSVPTISDGHGGLIPTSSVNIRTFTQPNSGTDSSWSGNSMTSDWIGPDNSDPLNQPAGRYYYSTTFTLGPDLDPSTARIDVYLFGDDGVADIRLNTWDTGFQDFVPGTIQSPYQVPYHFLLDQAFLPGDNLLEFRVDNSGGPSGLRVQIFSSVEQSDFSGGTPGDIPEPASGALVLVGLLGLALRRPLAARFSSHRAA
jgi:hypothetical protein